MLGGPVFAAARAGPDRPLSNVKGNPSACRPRPGKIIVSPRSASVAALYRLVRSREERTRTGLFYVEGMRFLAEAVAAGSEIETLIVAPDLLTHPFGRRLAHSLREKGIPCLEISSGIYTDLSKVEEPQGIAAVVRQRWERLERIRAETGCCWLAVDTIRSTGNLGTIFRTAEAVGAPGVFCIGDTIDPYDPAVVRATMGSPTFRLRFVRTTEREFVAWKRRTGLRLIGASPHAKQDYQSIDYAAGPVALWLGSERQGLSAGQQGLCDTLVSIPMAGRSDSLNVAIASAVLLYEVYNQKRRKG